MVEESEDEAQCDLDANMTSPKVILSQVRGNAQSPHVAIPLMNRVSNIDA